MPARKKSKEQLSKTARHVETLSKMASENLTPALFNRRLTEELAEAVLVRVAAGDTVRSVCKTLGIASGTVYSKAFNDPEFHRQLKAAREIGTHTLVDSIIEIADDESRSTERAKLVVDAIKWVAARLNRNDYGEKPLIHADNLSITLDALSQKLL